MSEEAPYPVLTALIEGLGASEAPEGSSQRGLCFAGFLGSLLDLERPSQMENLRHGAAEDMTNGTQEPAFHSLSLHL